MVAFVMLILIKGVSISLKRIKLNKTHGTAGWLTKKELKKIINQKNKGLVIDGINRLTRKDSHENLIIVAPTGQGKSSGFVIPNIILSEEYSTVVVDPSGEIFDSTAAGMQKMGFNIKLWSPNRDSHSFNLIHNVQTIKDAGMVGEAIMSRFASKSSPIWHKAGGTLLQSIFYYLHLQSAETKRHYKNMTNVIQFLGLPYEDQDLLIEAMDDDSLSFLYSSFRESNKEAKGGIQLMAKEGVSLFLEEKVANITKSHSINFQELRAQKTIVYLVFPELEIEYYSPLLQVFFGQLFHFANTNKEGCDIFTIIEEAGNMGLIPNLPKATTTLRKFNVNISLVLQELSQLDAIYGKENAEVIKSGGCVTKLFLPGLGSKACQEISDILGNQTIKNESKNQSENNKSNSSIGKTQSNIGRRLMTPDEVRKMKDWTALMIRKNQKPTKLKIKPTFKQKRFKPFIDYCNNNAPNLEFDTKEQSFSLELKALVKNIKEAKNPGSSESVFDNRIVYDEEYIKAPQMGF